jgi:hypothetical protein
MGIRIWPALALVAMMALPAVAQGARHRDAIPKETKPQDAPFEAATVQGFLAACGRDMSQCDFEIRMALLDKLPAKNAGSVCLKGAHYQQPVIDWLKHHAESWPMATEDGIYTAFRSLYPCP